VLNVFAPSADKVKRPVMVWIRGGQLHRDREVMRSMTEPTWHGASVMARDSLGGGLSCDVLSRLFSLGFSRRFEVFVCLVRY